MLNKMLVRNRFGKEPSFYELGRIYKIDEIQAQEQIVDNMEKRIEGYRETIRSLGVVRPALDVPKLSNTDKALYQKALSTMNALVEKAEVEKIKLGRMKATRALPKAQPSIGKIVEYAKQKKIFPSKAADYVDKHIVQNSGVFYPDYILMLANNMRIDRLKAGMTTALNFPIDYWADKVVKQEDAKNKNDNIARLVEMRKKAWKAKVEFVKENEKALQKDIVRDHVGVNTLKFDRNFIKKFYKGQYKTDADINDVNFENKVLSTANIPETPVRKSITPIANAVISKSTTVISQPKPISIVQPINGATGTSSTQVKTGQSLLSGMWDDQYSDDEMGFIKIGNPFKQLKKLVDNARKEFERALQSVVRNTIDSQLSKDLMPPELHKPLSKLSKASIKVMAGKISSENIGDILEASYGITAAASQSVTWVVDESTKQILASPVGQDLDRYSGGLISSVKRIGELDNDAIDGKKANVGQIISDSVKIAMAVANPVGVVTSASTQYVGQQTGLNKSAMGRSILSVGSAYASGGDVSPQALLENEVKKQASAEATKQATKALEPVIGKEGASIVGAAVSQSALNKATGKDANMIENIQSSATSKAKSIAKAEADKQVRKITGGAIGLDEARKIYELDPNEITQENAKKLINQEVNKVTQKLYNERAKMLNVKEQIEYEYKVARAKLEDPNAIAKLQAQTKARIDSESAKLESKYKEIQKEIDTALSSKGTEFNMQDEVNKIKNELAKNVELEKQRFLSYTMDDVFDLMKQYGPQLLAYLKYKYGPQPDYSKFVTEYDLNNYKNWQQPETIFPPKKSNLGRNLLLGSAVVAGAYIALND
jgi:hypothetical protein